MKLIPEEGAILKGNLPLPPIGEGDVLVKVKSVAICGTDLHIYRWDKWA